MNNSQSALEEVARYATNTDHLSKISNVQKQLQTAEVTLDTLKQLSQQLAHVQEELKNEGQQGQQKMEALLAHSEKIALKENNENNLRTYIMTAAVTKDYLETRQLSIIYQASPKREVEQQLFARLTALRDKVKGLENHLHRDSTLAMIRDVNSVVSLYVDNIQKFVQEMQQLVSLRATVRQEVNTLNEVLGKLSESAQTAVTNTMQSGIRQLLICLMIALVLGCLLAWLINRKVSAQLGVDPEDLSALANRVVQGDYSIMDDGRSVGVYGAFLAMVKAVRENIQNAQEQAQEAQRMGEQAQQAMQQAQAAQAEAESKTAAMHAAAGELENVVNTVSTASEQLAAQIEQSKRGAEAQAARVGETAAAMEEMNSTVLEVAKNAGAAAEGATLTREKAETGAALVRQCMEGIYGVQQG